MVAPIHAHVAPFTVEIHEHDGVPVIVIGGEIDTSNETQISNSISVQLEPRPSMVLIDLRKVRFLGSAGARLLQENHLHARSVGARLIVVAGHRAVLRTLAITQLDQVVEVHHGFPELLDHSSR
jgi:anti-anti-sigma factor